MQEYAIRIAKQMKSNAKKTQNHLALYYATIQQQEPLICNAMDGALRFQEGENLSLSDDIKQKMIADDTRQYYVGKTVALLGINDMIAFAILA